MRILLDEGVPRIIQKRLPHLQISTIDQMGWRGVKNGRLLNLMDGVFSILVTADRNLRYQKTLGSDKSHLLSYLRTEFHSSLY